MKSKRPDLFFKCPCFHRGHQIAFIVVEPEEVSENDNAFERNEDRVTGFLK